LVRSFLEAWNGFWLYAREFLETSRDNIARCNYAMGVSCRRTPMCVLHGEVGELV